MSKETLSAVQVIDAVREGKGILTVAARRLGCTRQTVANYIDRYPTVKAAFEEARESQIDFAESKLLKNIDDGDTTSIIFFLKTIGKNRGYTERTELTGAGGKAIEHNVVGSIGVKFVDYRAIITPEAEA